MASASSGLPSKTGSPAPSAPASSSAEQAAYFVNAEAKNAPSEKAPDDSSKLKTFLGILRKFIGVTDIASVRFSLPAQLMEPIPNLEYWHYLDRPETFISMADSEDPLGRMLGVLRFWFTKDLKYVKGKPCKPYNSVLGEFFRCNWDVDDTSPLLHPNPKGPGSSASSVKGSQPVRISYLTEQTSHHPPVSAFFIDCPAKGIQARGYDQLSAKFTGTSIRVVPGSHNLGIFINLQKFEEEYQLTHPAAQLGGIIRGSLSISVADSCYITCPKTGIKVILQYLEEGWLGKAQNKVEGIIFKYDPENDTVVRIRDVPDKDILGRVEGCWMEKVYFTVGPEPFAKSKNKTLLMDLGPLYPVAKALPPPESQLPNESARFWSGLTHAILNKQYSFASTVKHQIEERQREKAAERKERGVEWQPRFFTGAVTPVGRPDLTDEGRAELAKMQRGEWDLEPSAEMGAM